MKRILFADSLFVFQVVLALVFGVNQFIHMLNTSTNGLSTSTFLYTTTFVGINLHLSLASHQVKASRVTVQTIIIYIIGTFIYSLLTALMIIKSDDRWDSADTTTSLLVLALVFVSFIYTKIKNIRLLDPVMKGVYGLILRVIPQFALAWKIFQHGGEGLSVVMVVIFHILTLSRIFQIFRSIKEAGWDRNRTGLAVAEIGNEVSWTLVTVAWLI